ncbi:hypothetical protein L1049_012384 [Liquidambar formosana]|uniref:Uncharacterized protein n=1 Tax=Liquidambar formosana TaxID=63359 RepID=A0AAP0R1K2_LIQFO
MPMPPFQEGFDFDIHVGYFGESRGHLHLFVIDDPPTEIDILELKTDYSEWFVRYRLNLWITFPEINWNSFTIYEALSILCVNRAEKEESILVLFVYGEGLKYTPQMEKKTTQETYITHKYYLL